MLKVISSQIVSFTSTLALSAVLVGAVSTSSFGMSDEDDPSRREVHRTVVREHYLAVATQADLDNQPELASRLYEQAGTLQSIAQEENGKESVKQTLSAQEEYVHQPQETDKYVSTEKAIFSYEILEKILMHEDLYSDNKSLLFFNQNIKGVCKFWNDYVNVETAHKLSLLLEGKTVAMNWKGQFYPVTCYNINSFNDKAKNNIKNSAFPLFKSIWRDSNSKVTSEGVVETVKITGGLVHFTSLNKRENLGMIRLSLQRTMEIRPYQITSDNIPVKPGTRLTIPYTISVEPGGIMDFALSSPKGWYGERIILKEGYHQGIYKVRVPEGESTVYLAFSMSHGNTPGQSTCKIHALDIQEESAEDE